MSIILRKLHKTQICNSPFSIRVQPTTSTLNDVPGGSVNTTILHLTAVHIRIAMTVAAHFTRPSPILSQLVKHNKLCTYVAILVSLCQLRLVGYAIYAKVS